MNVLTMCFEDIPKDFEPLTRDTKIEDSAPVTPLDVLLFFANLSEKEDVKQRISDLCVDCFSGDMCDQDDLSKFETCASNIIPCDYVKFFEIIIKSIAGGSSPVDTRLIIGEIERICDLSKIQADLLSDPAGFTEGGRQKKDALVSLLSATNYHNIAFDMQYHPILGYCGEKFTFVNAFLLTDVLSTINLASLIALKEDKIIRKCKNCGEYFSPKARSDELYCSKININGKTCKEVGYDNKVKDDDVLRTYRKIYKTQNARKQRNQHKKNIEEKFGTWKNFAKEQLKACQNGEITLKEFEVNISSNNWM